MTDVANTACIFCGRTGATVKITKEHTFSDWVNDVLTPADLGPDITCERSISQGPRSRDGDLVARCPGSEPQGAGGLPAMQRMDERP
jgi:hypothetical protein